MDDPIRELCADLALSSSLLDGISSSSSSSSSTSSSSSSRDRSVHTFLRDRPALFSLLLAIRDALAHSSLLSAIRPHLRNPLGGPDADTEAKREYVGMRWAYDTLISRKSPVCARNALACVEVCSEIEIPAQVMLSVGGRGSQASLMGVSREDIMRDVDSSSTRPFDKLRDDEIKATRIYLEDELTEILSRCADLIDPSDGSVSNELLEAKIDALPDRVYQLLNELDLISLSIFDKKQNISSLEIRIVKTLAQCVQILCQISEDHLLDESTSAVEQCSTTRTWMHDRVRAMILKLSVLKYEYLRDTYTKEANEALSSIRENLITRLSEVRLEKQRKRELLDRYEKLMDSREFSSLRGEWKELRREIREKKWALNEITSAIERK